VPHIALSFAFLISFCCMSAYAAGSGTIIADFQRPVVADTGAPEKAEPHPESYYLTGSGKKIQFKVRKKVFLLTPKPPKNKKRLEDPTRLVKALEKAHGSDVNVKRDKQFKGKVRSSIKEGKDEQKALRKLRKRSDIAYISAVLVTESGTEIALSPGVVIRMRTDGPPGDSLLNTLASLGIELLHPLSDSEREFLFTYDGLVEDSTGLFQSVRAAMKLPEVEWAEPNFEAVAIREFTPNDPLFPDQWHLDNTGQNGGQVEADVDALRGWDLSRGAGTIVAVVDDGVELDHPDLVIWINPGESGSGKETNGVDDDSNGYIDDYQGWDFTDGDNNPGPGASDNHGTAVAGVAAARGDNALGVSGSATHARILPVRITSGSCSDFGNAIRYAASYADVVNNSWGIGACNSQIDSAIAAAVGGTLSGARRAERGTPVLFAAGNAASGWIRFSISGVPAGTHVFEWEYAKDFSVSDGYDTMWLDDISWPGGGVTDFEGSSSLPGGFSTGGDANWAVVSDGTHARGATGNATKAGSIGNNDTTTLYATRTVDAGTLTFWAWVSSEQSYDEFNLYVTVGTTRFGPFFGYSPGQNGHQNSVGYPASNANAIAVGASNDGEDSGQEERSYYSQFGSELDVVAPSSGGSQGITTTDRQGTNGYNSGSDYTSFFGGTSSSSPLAAGVVADLIGRYPYITATQARDALRSGADQIGPYAYVADRNDYYGHGRVNLLSSLQWVYDNNLAFDCDIPDKLVASQWSLIGMPCKVSTPDTVSGALGDNLDMGKYGIDWIAWQKVNTGANNVTALTTGSPLTPGPGYWITSLLGDAAGGSFLDGGALDVPGTTTEYADMVGCASVNGCFAITLNPPAGGDSQEWNLVAHPHAYAVDWADARIVVDGVDIYVPSAAETADIVAKAYQAWTGSAYAPFDDVTPGMEGTLQPGQGFMVEALPGSVGHEIKLLVPAAPSLNVSHRNGAEEFPWFAHLLDWLIPAAHAGEEDIGDRWSAIGYEEREEKKSAGRKRQNDGGDWYVRLSVEAADGKMRDAGNVFGQLADSLEGYDSHDLQERTPTIAGYLTLVFPHGNWGENAGNYASDYRGYSPKEKWNFEIHVDEVGREVNLCWEGPEDVIKRSVLVDLDTKRRYHLKKQPELEGCISLVMDATVRRFRWKYRQ
jgi:subtilisin family serine protease